MNRGINRLAHSILLEGQIQPEYPKAPNRIGYGGLELVVWITLSCNYGTLRLGCFEPLFVQCQ